MVSISSSGDGGEWRNTVSSGRPTELHRFGGDWTEAKLAVLRKYLGAYTTALKNQPFRLGYIDAFAGSGYRADRRPVEDGSELPVFPDLATPAAQKLLDGSARIALKTEPPFDRYVFVEQNAGRCDQLERLGLEFPERSERIRIYRGEANAVLQDLCAKNWQGRRAVLFLDPYGMQVEWDTVEAVAATQAIDLWLLFPLGIGVNRLLPRSGDVPAGWRRKLDSFLGTTDWYDAFYSVRPSPQGSLFGEPAEQVVKASVSKIGEFFQRRLEERFPGVVEPGVLRNSINCPLYLLCFAAANERGAKPACRIARDLLKGLR
jgi:three-Cys-motif partner protein